MTTERRGGWNKGRRSEKTRTIIELRRCGKSLKEISAALDVDVSYAGKVCRQAGLGGAIIDQRLTESQIAESVSKSGFTYVGGYKSTKKPITVQCRECGRTFERQAHIFREVANGTWQSENECPLCREDRQREERKRKQVEKEAERERAARIKAEQRAAKQADLISRQTVERLAIHVCKNCGTEYSIEATGYNSKQYCSERCMKRWVMRIKNDRRLKRMKARQHDTDITLEKLFNKESGVCYLCGKRCDWNDVDADGNAQGDYPSIDHVRPLSKGGTHTWNNVRLACRHCNNTKGSRF